MNNPATEIVTTSLPGSKAKVPAYILVGFLGSGKTTLLGRLIGWCLQNDLKPGLILNEIGSAWIDAEAVRQEDFDLTTLSDGCLCCTAEDELLPALTTMAARPDTDLILLEASGLADPGDMLDALTDPVLWQTVEVAGVISVLDSSRFQELAVQTRLAERQVAFSDVLIMNKCDLISREERHSLQGHLARIAPRAQVFAAENGLPYAGVEAVLARSLEIGRKRQQARQNTQSRLNRAGFNLGTLVKADSPIVTESNLNTQVGQTAEAETHGHEELSIHVTTFDFTEPVDKLVFEVFLKSLPKTVYRAKGFLRVKGSDELHTFQHMPGYTRVLPVTTHQLPALRGVFIGQDLDQAWLAMKIADCHQADISG